MVSKGKTLSIIAIFGIGTAIACGHDDKESTAPAEISSAKDISAATFTGVPKIRTHSEILTAIQQADLTNYSPPSINAECMLAKTKFGPADADGFHEIDSSTKDVADCFAPSEFSNFESVKVLTRDYGRASVSIGGQPVDLQNLTWKDAADQLLSASVYEARQFVQSRLVVEGILKNGNTSRFELQQLLQGPTDGEPCREFRIDGGRHTESACSESMLQTSTTGGTVDDQSLQILSHASDITAESYAAKYFDEGVVMSIQIDGWKGSVLYRGADLEPYHSLQNGSEIESNMPKTNTSISTSTSTSTTTNP